MKNFQKFCLRSKILKISIWVKISKNINFGQKSQFPTEFKKNFVAVNNFENLVSNQNFRKISISVKIFEQFRFRSPIPKILIWVKIFKKHRFGPRFWFRSKFSILVKKKKIHVFVKKNSKYFNNFGKNFRESRFRSTFSKNFDLVKNLDFDQSFGTILISVKNFGYLNRGRNF